MIVIVHGNRIAPHLPVDVVQGPFRTSASITIELAGRLRGNATVLSAAAEEAVLAIDGRPWRLRRREGARDAAPTPRGAVPFERWVIAEMESPTAQERPPADADLGRDGA